ncbi:hypothetical protein TNCV_1186881 [Trichonephila clavipes]|nr:hypothetical protein TNCV_1186881 [Trichonephila clavipes]
MNLEYSPGSSNANLAQRGTSEDSLEDRDVVSAAPGLARAANAGGILGNTKSMGLDWLQRMSQNGSRIIAMFLGDLRLDMCYATKQWSNKLRET